MSRIVYRRRDIGAGEPFLRFTVRACNIRGRICGRLHYGHRIETGERVFYHSPPDVPVQKAWQQACQDAQGLQIPVILVSDPEGLFQAAD